MGKGKIIAVYLIRATLREADPEGLAEGVAAAADEPPVIAELEGAVGAAVRDRLEPRLRHQASTRSAETPMVEFGASALTIVRAVNASRRLRDALEQARDRFESMGNHMKPDLTAADRESLATDWWFGMQEVEAALAATPQDPEETR